MHEIVFSKGFKLTAASPAAAYVVRCASSVELHDASAFSGDSELGTDGILYNISKVVLKKGHPVLLERHVCYGAVTLCSW